VIYLETADKLRTTFPDSGLEFSPAKLQQQTDINCTFSLACEQALRGRGVVERKERELAMTSQEFEFRLQCSYGSLLPELPDFGQSVQSRSKIQYNKHV